jgi:hypothetical protein
MTDRHWAAGRLPPTAVVITVEVLEKCLDRLARIIDQAGDRGVVYLPIYDRLEAELMALKDREDRLARIHARVRR